jgi:SAM-dependent methyltransferase
MGRLQGHFLGHEISVHGAKWNELWEQGYTPWDRSGPSPALEDLLTDQEDLLGPPFIVDPANGKKRKRALVPGCGSGYDVLLLAAFGYDAFGLDVSETALKAAKEGEARSIGMDAYRVRDEELGRGKVTWLAGDFFTDEFLKDIGGDGMFDLLYDYTVCAWYYS